MARYRPDSLTVDDLRQRLVINKDEAAAVLRIDRATLRKAIDRGEIPHVNVQGRILIPTGPLLRCMGLSDEQPPTA